MVKRLIESEIKLKEIIFEHSDLLRGCFILLAAFSYLIGVHTTISRDIIFIGSLFAADKLSYLCGAKVMAEFVLDHPEGLTDENNK